MTYRREKIGMPKRSFILLWLGCWLTLTSFMAFPPIGGALRGFWRLTSCDATDAHPTSYSKIHKNGKNFRVMSQNSTDWPKFRECRLWRSGRRQAQHDLWLEMIFIHTQQLSLNIMSSTTEQNKRLALEAFDTLFNKRDYATAEKFWSPNYIQHSAHIEPGREGLFNLIKTLPPTLRYEAGTVVAEGEFVFLHGRFSGMGFQEAAWVVVDILRIKDGILVEHWDVIQNEASKQESKSGLPMFGESFIN